MNELSIGCFALSLVLEVGGLLAWRHEMRKSRMGQDAVATVVDRVTLGSGERDTVLIVEFPVGERTVRAKVNGAHAPFDIAPGDEIAIGYDPQSPGKIVLRQVKVPVSIFALGGISFGFGVFFSFLR